MDIDRNSNGTFGRTHFSWDGLNWEDGYINNRGRFMVYRPDYPKSYKDGYSLRAHIVWWINTGKIPNTGEEIHHKDENKLNDDFSNLELLTKDQHDKLHGLERQRNITLSCDYCGKLFTLKKSRANRYKTCFCSRACNVRHYWKVRRYA